MLGIVDIDYGVLLVVWLYHRREIRQIAVVSASRLPCLRYAKACNHTLFAYATNALQVCALGAVARSSPRDEVHVRKEL